MVNKETKYEATSETHAKTLWWVTLLHNEVNLSSQGVQIPSRCFSRFSGCANICCLGGIHPFVCASLECLDTAMAFCMLFVCILFWTCFAICECSKDDVDDNVRRQRIQIHFCIGLGLTGVEIIHWLCLHHGCAMLHLSTVYRWIAHFWSGNNSAKDNPRGGHPLKLTTQVINQIRQAVTADPTLSIKELSLWFGLGMVTIHCCLHKKLHLKKRPSRWIPHHLTTAHRLVQVNVCRRLLALH